MNKSIKLICWIVLFQAIGFLLGWLTQSNIPFWYNHLNRSSLTPPGFVFSIVWTLLYIVLAIVAWILSNQNPQDSCKKINTLFALQMLMNWAWTPLFFTLHWLIASAIWLVTLSCLNLYLIKASRHSHPIIARLLIPYVIWLMFASYLNVMIALMN